MIDRIAIILAAGKGKRMNTDLPKVLHTLNGRPMVDYVIDNARKAGYERIVLVVGHKYEQVIEHLRSGNVNFAIQSEQRGTGHAVKCARDQFYDFEGTVLVLPGDMPLVSSYSIKILTESHLKCKASATVLSVKLSNPSGYGRIVRDQAGNFLRITEHRDANHDIRKINEINTGVICFDSKALCKVLDEIRCENEQGEYYLTDSIEIFVRWGAKVNAIIADDYREGMGINSIDQLREVENMMRTSETTKKIC